MKLSLENREPISDANCQAALTLALGRLGLSFRLEKVNLTRSQQAMLWDQVAIVSQRIRQIAPKDDGQWLKVAELGGTPDAGGWITRTEPAATPY